MTWLCCVAMVAVLAAAKDDLTLELVQMVCTLSEGVACAMM